MTVEQRPTWFDLLRSGRQKLGVRREALAEATNISVDTIRSYELGRRGPKRDTLEAILAHLDLERHELSAILHSAGFVVESSPPAIDQQKLTEQGERVPWPQVILTSELHILSSNSILRRIPLTNGARIPEEHQFGHQAFVAMADERVYEALVNWEEVLQFHIAYWKKTIGPQLPTERPWMPVLAQRLSRLSKPKLGRFLDLWERTPPTPSGTRAECLHVWRHPEFGYLRFLLLNGSIEDCPNVLVQDWCPADADTWRAIESVRGR